MTYTAHNFRDWIEAQTSPDWTTQSTDKAVVLDTDYATATINFYDQDLVEMIITEKKDDSTGFYLHFQVKDKDHAENLFTQLTDTLMKMKQRKQMRVLLSCTSGLTTNFFAQELQNAAELLKLDFTFNAVAFNTLYDCGYDYDAILLAPQIAYTYEDVCNVFKDKLVLKIPAAAFAQYQTGEVIDLVREEFKAWHSENREEKPQNIYENDHVILTIGAIRYFNTMRFGVRVYDHGTITEDYEVIKDVFHIEDMHDIAETVLVKHPDVDMIGLAMPGIAHLGFLSTDFLNFNHVRIAHVFEERYARRAFLVNDANAAACGWKAVHEDDTNVVFYFHPYGTRIGGAGAIVNGRLMKGQDNTAGECGPLINHLLHDLVHDTYLPEDAIKDDAWVALAYTCLVAPETFVIYDDLVPDATPVKELVAESVHDGFVPDITAADGLKSYILPGLAAYCLITEKEWPDYWNLDSEQANKKKDA